jgi:hypothetical protein
VPQQNANLELLNARIGKNTSLENAVTLKEILEWDIRVLHFQAEELII